MLLLSWNVDYYLGDEEDGPAEPDIFSLTCMFFFLNFLAATQVCSAWGKAELHRIDIDDKCPSIFRI